MKKVLLALISFLYFGELAAQQVTSISFEGNDKTKPEYLSYFIKTQLGEALDSVLLEKDRQQLANLEVLSDAQYQIKITKEGYEVVFQCQELFTLLPILNFGGIEENFWVLAGATQVNLLGRGHKIYSYYQHYDRSSFGLNLQLDRLKGSPWGLNVNLVKWGTREPLFFDAGQVDYNYDNYTYGLDGVYRFDFFNKLLIGGAFFTEDYKAVSPLVEGAPGLAKKSKMLFKSQYECNRINYSFYYQSGYYNALNYQSVYSLDGDPTFHIVFNESRFFQRIGTRGNFASRLRIGLSSNQESPFAPFVLDSYLNIRGVGNRVDRGTGAIVSNIEYRHSIWDRNWLAIQAVAFSDLGTWRQPGGTLEDFTQSENVVWFGGLGVRFIHKQIYNAVLRVDYGVDMLHFGGNGFVIGVGQYF